MDGSTAIGILPRQSRGLVRVDLHRIDEEHALHRRRALVGATLHAAVVETHLVGQVLGVGSVGKQFLDDFVCQRRVFAPLSLDGHSRNPAEHLAGIEHVAGACQRAHTRIDMVVALTNVRAVAIDEVRTLHGVVVVVIEAHVMMMCVVLFCILYARDGIILYRVGCGIAGRESLVLRFLAIVVLVVPPDDGVVERRGSCRLIRELDMSAVHGEGAVDDAHAVGALQRIARPGVEHTVVDERAAASLLYAHGRHRFGSCGTILLEDTVLDSQLRHAGGVELRCSFLRRIARIALELLLIVDSRTTRDVIGTRALRMAASGIVVDEGQSVEGDRHHLAGGFGGFSDTLSNVYRTSRCDTGPVSLCLPLFGIGDKEEVRHVVGRRCRLLRHLQDGGVLFDVACADNLLTVSTLDGQALRLILIAGDDLLLQCHHLIVFACVDLETVVALVEGVGRRVGSSHNLHNLRFVVTAQEQRLDGTLQVTGRGVPRTSVGCVRTRTLHVRHPHHVDAVAVGDGELRVLVLVHANVDIVLGGVTQWVGGDTVHILLGVLLVLVVGVVHILITAQRQEGKLETVVIVF